MSHPFASRFTWCAFALCAVVGCGPRDVPATGLNPGAAPTTEVKAAPTTATQSPGNWPMGADKVDWAKVVYKSADVPAVIADWAANPSAAFEKYRGKPNGVQFVGVIREVGSGASKQTLLSLSTADKPDATIYISVATEGAKSDFNKFRVGDTVSVKAVASPITSNEPHFLASAFSPAK